MADRLPLLTSKQMAQFVAAGFVRFDGVVDPAIGDAMAAELDSGRELPRAGRPLASVNPDGSPFQRMLQTPVVAGAIRSLVGPDAFAHNHDTHVRPAATRTRQDHRPQGGRAGSRRAATCERQSWTASDGYGSSRPRNR